MESKDLREDLAALSHEIWAHWMKYMDKQVVEILDRDGEYWFAIPMDKHERWFRQMITPYAKLSWKEQESDRDQADKIIDLLYEQGYLVHEEDLD